MIAGVDGRQDIRMEQVDMIVVLGGGMRYAGEAGWLPSFESYRRMSAAMELQGNVGSRTPV